MNSTCLWPNTEQSHMIFQRMVLHTSTFAQDTNGISEKCIILKMLHVQNTATMILCHTGNIAIDALSFQPNAATHCKVCLI